MFDDNSPLWVIHIGFGSTAGQTALDQNFICIGWDKLGNLANYNTRELMKAAMTKAWPDWKPNQVRSMYGQVFRFAHEMSIGDAVIYPVKGTRNIAIGKIATDYEYRENSRVDPEHNYTNFRGVDWLKVVPRTSFSQSALHSFGSFSTLTRSDDHLEEVNAVLAGKDFISSDPPLIRDKVDSPIASKPDTTVTDEPFIDLFASALQETEDYLLKEWLRSGSAFEHVVAGVLEAIGYTAKVTRASNDHGVDVIAHPDPLGLQPPFIKVQAKSGTTTVGEPEVSQLIGTLSEGERGILIGLGGFSKQAESRARHSSKISLIGPTEFVELFLDHYEKLDPKWRTRFPLQRVYVPGT